MKSELEAGLCHFKPMVIELISIITFMNAIPSKNQWQTKITKPKCRCLNIKKC